MPVNPAIRALGFPDDARLLVTHLDDVGMNLGTNSAWEACHLAGALASASVMMPCPWAPEALSRGRRMAEEGPEVPDLGVHLTVTCEWDVYRWGPMGPGRRDLLTDAEGYFPRTAEEHQSITSTLRGRAAVRDEVRAQLEAALAGYPDITHIDTHMFAMLHPANIRIYLELAREYRLPAMVPGTEEAWRPWCEDDVQARELARIVAPAGEEGMPLFDRVAGVPLSDPPADRPAAARQIIRESVPGLNFLFFHANEPTPEARSIAGDWEARRGDLEVFTDPGLREFIEGERIHLVGMRELRELIRS